VEASDPGSLRDVLGATLDPDVTGGLTYTLSVTSELAASAGAAHTCSG
jgi:hypothetical protein